jgi:hypothetical protein
MREGRCPRAFRGCGKSTLPCLSTSPHRSDLSGRQRPGGRRPQPGLWLSPCLGCLGLSSKRPSRSTPFPADRGAERSGRESLRSPRGNILCVCRLPSRPHRLCRITPFIRSDPGDRAHARTRFQKSVDACSDESSCHRRQQFLNFRPLPHGHGLFRRLVGACGVCRVGYSLSFT